MASSKEIGMNYELLQNKIKEYKTDLERNPGKHSQEWQDRNELCLFYQSHTSSTLSNIDEEGLLEYLSSLWSMLIWGNKRYIVDRYFLWNRRALVGLHYLLDLFAYERHRQHLFGQQ